MASQLALAASLLLAGVSAQQMGAYTPEVHPVLTSQRCTVAGGCKTVNTAITLDSGSRWLHAVGAYNPCNSNGSFNTTLCPDVESCAKNCALEGQDYAAAGITTKGDAMTLDLYVKRDGVLGLSSPRVYLLAEDGKSYDMFSLLNKEISFDVDMSQVPCQVNGALYFSEMAADGGRSTLNPAGATYGTGYCDAQCPTPEYINGVANLNHTYGACCNEMDLWEANAHANSFTPHPCNITGLYSCEGTLCGHGSERYDGVCDEDGCGFNAYHNGVEEFYGVGADKTINTNEKFTVVTQFITTDNTTTGDLKEIRRIYVQNGKVIQNTAVDLPGQPAVNSETDSYCSADKFHSSGAMAGMGKAIQRGMVLVFSIWQDTSSGGMLWLDGNAGPGQVNGDCPSTILDANDLMATYSNASVIFSNIKSGELGSTYMAPTAWKSRFAKLS